ncbi:hypothetical protein SANTM175S_01373 [Streptomyces antimycoticus]
MQTDVIQVDDRSTDRSHARQGSVGHLVRLARTAADDHRVRVRHLGELCDDVDRQAAQVVRRDQARVLGDEDHLGVRQGLAQHLVAAR